LAACGGNATPNGTPTPIGENPNQPSPTPAGQVTISYAAWDYERSLYEGLAERFSQENPNIRVVIVPLDDLMITPPDSTDSAIATLRRIASGADVAPSFQVVPEALGTPILLDMKPYMDADANFQRSDFFPGALERWSKDGGQWVLPRAFYIQTLTYNKDLFAAAGIPDPKPGITWSELLAIAEQAQQSAGPGAIGMFDTSGGIMPMLGLLKQRNIDLFALKADQIQLTDPVYLEVINELRDLYKRKVLANPYDGQSTVPPQELVQSGQVAIWSDIGFFGPNGEPINFGFANSRIPYPVDTPIDAIFGGGSEGFMISGGTSYPEASWRWAEFLSRQSLGQEGTSNWQGSGRVPARQSLADTVGFFQNEDTQTTETYRWSLEQLGKSSPITVDYNIFGSIGQVASQAISDPKADVRQLLTDAQRQIEDYLTIPTTPTPPPDTSPVIVATPEPQVAPDGATVITFPSWGFSSTDLRRITRAFREEHPDIYVQIKNTDTLTVTTIADLAALSDCFAWSQPLQDPKEAESLLDIRPLIDADATFPRDDIPPALLSAYEQNGGLYGLPYTFNVRNLVYNRTLFEKAGITPPGNTPWTYEEFLQAAQALTDTSGSEPIYGYVPLGGPSTDLFFFSDLLEGSLTTGSGLDTRATFSAPESVKAIQWYLDLAAVYKVTPEFNFPYKRDDYGNDRSYEFVSSGRAGMWFDYGRSGFGMVAPSPSVGGPTIGDPAQQETPSFDVGVAPLPLGQLGLGKNDIYMRGFHISKNTTNPQACWEFVKYLSTDVNQTYGDLPARASVANSAAYQAIASPDRLEVLAAYQEVLKRPLRDSNAVNIFSVDTYWFFKAVMAAVQGTGDLATELTAAEKTTNTFMECSATGEKASTCALQADPEYDGYNVEQPDLMPMPVG
jgi:ABC-type glycerol-3-phosphate transport system substrate-binding protein